MKNRDVDIIGLLLGAVVFALSAVFLTRVLSGILFQPMISGQIGFWIVYGMLPIYLYICRCIVKYRKYDVRADARGLVISVACFVIWFGVNVFAYVYNINMPFLVNIIGGYALTLCALLIGNQLSTKKEKTIL